MAKRRRKKAKVKIKRKYSVKRMITFSEKRLNKIVIKTMEPVAKTLYNKLRKKGYKKKKLKNKFLKIASKQFDLIYSMTVDRIKMAQFEKIKNINIEDYSNKDLRWYASLFETRLYKDKVIDRKTNFMTRLIQGLESRIDDITNIDVVKEILGGLSVDELGEFAEFAMKKEKTEKFFYDIWLNTEEYSNDDIIRLVLEFAESINKKNSYLKKLNKLMN